MAELVIAEGTKVVLHFAVKLSDGDIIDSTFEGEPATFTVGDGNLLAGFEEFLLGLPAGTKKVFMIPPEKGFGQHNPGNIQALMRDQFDNNLILEKGLVLSFSDAQNAELPGVIIDVNETEVVVDFNHPLAGKDVQFEVDIISVEPVITH